MPCKCNTSDFLWDSVLNGVTDDGKISVGPEDASTGDFDGDHLNSSQRIRGRCTPEGMWFHVPAHRPQYFYNGKFTDDTCKKIHGTRTRLGTFVKGELGAALTD